MTIDLKIPHVGESITEVQIAEWLKSEGEMVTKDETVAVIDSEKTTLDLPAPESGRLTKISHQAGDKVKVGEIVAQIEPATDIKGNPAGKTDKPKAEQTRAVETKPELKAAPVAEKAKPDEKDEEKEAEPQDAAPNEDSQKTEQQTAQPAPSSAKMEDKKVIPPAPLETKAKASTLREEKVVPLTMLRRTAARRLVEAKQQMAMLTTFNEVDMSAVQALRKEHQEAFEKRHQTRLGFMSFFVKATLEALKELPQLNATIRADDVIYPGYFDIGVAIASERGLVVPILRNAEQMDFAGVEKAIGDFARRAKEGKLKPHELEGGTFTITNGGVFGSLFSTPIINPPQSGILGMHTIQERPVAVQGQVVIRPMMYVALTYDHRIVDGREAVLFLRRIKESIESPARLLLGI